MLLSPSNINHEKSFRLNNFVNYNPSNLNFGDIGLKLLTSLVITSLHLSSYLILLNNLTSKSDNTLSYFWLNFPVSIPFTENAKGSSMGKGNGKVFIWGAKLNSGKFFVEFKGLSFGSSLASLNIFSSSLPSNLTIHVSDKYTNSNRFLIM